MRIAERFSTTSWCSAMELLNLNDELENREMYKVEQYKYKIVGQVQNANNFKLNCAI